MLPRFVERWKEHAVSTFRGVLDRRIVENASALYASHFAHLLLPLVTIPYLARVLGPETWGVVILIQAIGMYVQLVVNYGFQTLATREVARHPSDTERVSRVAAGVLGGRLILLLSCIIIIGIAQIFVPFLRRESLMLWLGVFWFVSVGIRPFWYFLGIERVGKYVMLELAGKTVAVVGIFLLVRGPADAWLVFALQGAGAAAATVIGMALVYRSVPFYLPSLDESWRWLKQGWHLFIFYASNSLYSTSNALILGFVAAPINVSFYGGAERIGRAMISIMMPMVQALFPRVSNLMVDDHQAAARLARWTILMFSLAGLLAYITLFFLAPLLIQVILGDGYGESVNVLRILLLLLPILGVSMPLSAHWLVPLGLESLLTKVTVSAGILHIPMAIFLGYHFAHIGIAWSVIVTEIGITSVLITISLVRSLGPFRLSSSREVIGKAS